MELSNQNEKTEYGDLPKDWTIKSLNHEIDLLTGFPFPSSHYSRTGVRLLRGSNVKRGVTDWNPEITQYWPKVTSDLKEYVMNEGDIVVAMDGSLVGKSFARLTRNDVPSLLLQRVARIRSTRIDLGYLKEFVCSDYFTKYCDTVKTSSAIPHISPSDIRNFRIPVPPTKSEQTAIAAALSDADALIASLEKLIAKKRLIKQGVMQKLLEPKDGWAEKSFGEIFHFLSTSNYSRAQLSEGGEIGYIHYGDIHTKWNGFMDVSKNHLPKVTRQQAEGYAFVQHGDLIVVDASEDYSGVSKSIEVINPNNEKVISGLHTFLLRDKEPSFVDGFRGYIQSSQIVKEQLDRLATGMKVFGVSKGNLKTVMIPIPPKSEQKVIVSILRDIDKEVDTLDCKLAKMRFLKQGMMQTLLTGKIRLI